MLNKKVDQSLGDESVCDEANSKRGLACGQIGAFIHLISPTTSPSLPSYGTQRKRLHQYHLVLLHAQSSTPLADAFKQLPVRCINHGPFYDLKPKRPQPHHLTCRSSFFLHPSAAWTEYVKSPRHLTSLSFAAHSGSGFPASTMGYYQSQPFQSIIPNLKMDPSYKVDEGYSEDTRSQDGLESPNMEMGNDALLVSQLGVGGVLPPGVMALSEAERSGVLARALYAVLQPPGYLY